jgi:DNA repair exonuclease SbcCD nuclease subunit
VTVRAILTADNHLDPTAINFGPEKYQRKEDFLKCFNEMIEYAKKEKPDLFLMGGDLFDFMRPSNRVRAAVMNDFRMLHESGVRVFAVSGHHDTPKGIEEGTSPLAVYGRSGLMHFFADPTAPETVTLEVEGCGVTITGVSHNPLHEGGDDPLRHINLDLQGDFNILLAHCPVQGFSGWTGDEPIIKPSSIPPRVNLLVVGHFHKFQEKKIGNTTIIYPGSTERVDMAEEEDPKGFVWLEFDKDGEISTEFIETSARPCRTIHVQFPDVPKPLEAIETEASKAFERDLILRLRLYGKTTPTALTGYRRSEVQNFAQGKVFHCFVEDEELEIKGIERPDLGPRTTPLQELELYFKKQMETATEEERSILMDALRMSRDKLQEAGAW